MAISQQLPLNLSVVRSLRFAATANERYFVQDTKDEWFGLRVGTNKKTFIAWAGAKGNAISVATFGDVTPTEARKLAAKVRAAEAKRVEEAKAKQKAEAARIAAGGDPAENEPPKPGDRTLEEGIQIAVASIRRKGRRPKTIDSYEVALRSHLSDWLTKPMAFITPERVRVKHAELSIKRPRSGEKGDRGKYRGGPVLADGIMRLLGRVLKSNLIVPNPVDALSVSGWNNAKGRGNEVPTDNLAATYSAILSLADARGRDMLLLALYTGLRSHEARSLTWDRISFDKRSITIPAEIAKNGRELVIPMSRQVWAILKQREADVLLAIEDKDDPRRACVFPSAIRDGVKPYMDNARCQYKAASKAGGAKFTTHSLRHSFVSHAVRADISQAKQKYLVNHVNGSDITSRYQHVALEDVRDASQKIADQIDAAAKVAPKVFASHFRAKS